ncbi:MAG TPA: GGDEF domain-containing protein, partial [Chromatiaceae bacterium]|nr:GGDEF domain-containing protein [Chromatiaceae bacterium]
LYPGDGDTPSTLLRNADSAMYHAKARGRNTYAFFTREMNRRVSRRLQVEEQMHGALAKGEFRLAYQPQIDMRGNVIFGFEALLRWNNPVLGAVSPEEFVPIAEHTGLIVPLGRFVITEAVAVLARLKQRIRGDLCMAINLSPSQFRDPGLVAFVSSALRRAGIAGEALELEITEGVLMDGHGYVDKALGEFTGVGIRLVMDDFGTGYSSLSYLRSYPFDVIKIDRSFVHDIIIDEEDRELVSAAISMAHGLNMKVVAEGVETREQLELLARMGCDCAQGNLFSEAVSEDGAARLLEAREKD